MVASVEEVDSVEGEVEVGGVEVSEDVGVVLGSVVGDGVVVGEVLGSHKHRK